MSIDEREPVLVHAWMSAAAMVTACGLRLAKATAFTYRVLSPANEVLFTGNIPGIKRWLRREGWVA